jgi:ATP-dependent RNA helicase DeaD
MKFDALLRILRYYDAQSGVIFCNTQQMVEKLADDLASNDCIVDRLHGGMAQAQRERVMANFRKSRFHYLVATDVAARGIDVNELGVVVNYDLPKDPEDYVHRIGRTGRAGKKGLALSLVTGAGMRSVSAIERFTGSRLTIDALPSQSAIRNLQGEKLLESFRVDLKNSEFTTEKELLQRLFDEGHSAEDVAAAVLHRMLPKHDATESVLDDEPDDRNHRRRKRRERPNARRDSRKKRRPEIQRAGGKRPPKKRKFQVKVQK